MDPNKMRVQAGIMANTPDMEKNIKQTKIPYIKRPASGPQMKTLGKQTSENAHKTSMQLIGTLNENLSTRKPQKIRPRQLNKELSVAIIDRKTSLLIYF